MAAIAYLLRKTIKNWLLDLKNKPQMLILIIFLIFTLAAGVLSRKTTRMPYNADMFSAIYLIATLLFGVSIFYGTLAETRSIFRMADVNLLFTSKVKPPQVILYGTIRNIGTLAFAMIFLIYQVNTLHYSLGMPAGLIAAAFACFFVSQILCLTTSMCLMLFCSGRPGRLSAVKAVLIAAVSVLILYAVFLARSAQGVPAAKLFTYIAQNPVFDYFPIIGWSRGLYAAIAAGEAVRAAVFGAPLLALLAAEMLMIATTKSDYYEDVLDGASRYETLRAAAKSGKRRQPVWSGKEKKIRRFGLGGGRGSSVYLYKRMLERSRGAFGIVGLSTAFAAGLAVLLSLVFRTPFETFLYIAAFACIVFRRISSWEGELQKIYIYLTPGRPEKKLFFILAPEMITSLIDTAIVLAAGAVLFRAAAPTVLAGSALYLCVCALISACSVVVRRLFGSESQNALVQIITVYMPMIIVGIGFVVIIVAGAILHIPFENEIYIYSGIAVWSLAFSALLLFLGRGVLKSAG